MKLNNFAFGAKSLALKSRERERDWWNFFRTHEKLFSLRTRRRRRSGDDHFHFSYIAQSLFLSFSLIFGRWELINFSNIPFHILRLRKRKGKKFRSRRDDVKTKEIFRPWMNFSAFCFRVAQINYREVKSAEETCLTNLSFCLGNKRHC